MIRHMIVAGSLTNYQIAEVAGCSSRNISAMRRKLRCFGSTHAPHNGGRRRRSIEPMMCDAICQYLLEKPNLYRDELVVFLWDEFERLVTPTIVGRTLKSSGWSKKMARRVAKEQNADLRDFYLHNISSLRSYHLVYVDESGCDTRVGFRRTGWSPLGVTPVQIARLHRGQRYQILPAYSQNGILLSRVFQGITNSEVFEDFIEQLLCHCGKWPEPNSVLVMDNAAFHHSERIEQMCNEAGVKLVYPPPYSPDLNPIEEFFAELKAFIKRNWKVFEDNPEQGFGAFLGWCVDVVGAKESSAKGHFRHAGLAIEEP